MWSTRVKKKSKKEVSLTQSVLWLVLLSIVTTLVSFSFFVQRRVTTETKKMAIEQNENFHNLAIDHFKENYKKIKRDMANVMSKIVLQNKEASLNAIRPLIYQMPDLLLFEIYHFDKNLRNEVSVAHPLIENKQEISLETQMQLQTILHSTTPLINYQFLNSSQTDPTFIFELAPQWLAVFVFNPNLFKIDLATKSSSHHFILNETQEVLTLESREIQSMLQGILKKISKSKKHFNTSFGLGQDTEQEEHIYHISSLGDGLQILTVGPTIRPIWNVKQIARDTFFFMLGLTALFALLAHSLGERWNRFFIRIKRHLENFSVGNYTMHPSPPAAPQGELFQAVSRLGEQLEKKEIQLSLVTDMAQKDSLTGLLNHSAFKRRLSEQVHPEKLKGIVEEFSLLMIDLDNYKNVNDMLGHQYGDYLLKIIAQVLLKHTRGQDFVSRYGGDEFAIALVKTHQYQAKLIAERIRAEIHQAISKDIMLQKTHCSCSIGVATHFHDETYEETLARADQSLYSAKHLGKNRVVGDGLH